MKNTDTPSVANAHEKPTAQSVGSGSSGSASVLQVVRRGETEPQYASRLVWLIGGLADWTKPVKVGDTVVEVTHRMGMARKQLGLHSALGELLKIEEEREGTTYTIRDIEGQERRWTNCKMCLVESSSPNAAYQPAGGEASTESKPNERKP